MARSILTTIAIALLIPVVAQAGDTEFVAAAREGDIARVQILLDQGVDPDARDEKGATALHYAAAYGQVDLVQILVEHGADVQARGPIGNTALIYAAQEGHTEVVRILVEHGADPQTPNDYNSTAPKLAVGHGYRDIVQILRESPAPQGLDLAGIIPVAGVILFGLLAAVALPSLGVRAINASVHS